MSDPSFFNAYGIDNTNIHASAIMECKICWHQYKPDAGDDYWQIPAGTPFAKLPEHWKCPQCDGRKEDFMEVLHNS